MTTNSLFVSNILFAFLLTHVYLNFPMRKFKFGTLQRKFSISPHSILLILKNKSPGTIFWNTALKASMFLSINYLLIKLPCVFFPNRPGHWIFLESPFEQLHCTTAIEAAEKKNSEGRSKTYFSRYRCGFNLRLIAFSGLILEDIFK